MTVLILIGIGEELRAAYGHASLGLPVDRTMLFLLEPAGFTLLYALALFALWRWVLGLWIVSAVALVPATLFIVASSLFAFSDAL